MPETEPESFKIKTIMVEYIVRTIEPAKHFGDEKEYHTHCRKLKDTMNEFAATLQNNNKLFMIISRERNVCIASDLKMPPLKDK